MLLYNEVSACSLLTNNARFTKVGAAAKYAEELLTRENAFWNVGLLINLSLPIGRRCFINAENMHFVCEARPLGGCINDCTLYLITP